MADLRIQEREGDLYQHGYTEDGEPLILRSKPYFAVIDGERLGGCDFTIDSYDTLAEAEVGLAQIKLLRPARWCGGGFCRCNEEG